MESLTKTLILASAIIVMTGCSSDSVNNAAAELEKFGVTNVYVANGTSQEIVAHLNGADVEVPDDETISSFSGIRLLSQFDTPDVYNLSYTINGADKGQTDVAKNTHLLYAATECGAGTEFISHELNGDNNVYIMNLTDTNIVTGTGIMDIMKDGTAITLPNVAPCTTTTLNVSATAGDWTVDINGMTIGLPNPVVTNSLVVFSIYNVMSGTESAAQTFITQ